MKKILLLRKIRIVFFLGKCSPIKDIEIKHLLQNALIDKINSREVFMRGIDISYYYEGYTEYDIEDL
ncbi:hypothetical protein ACUXEY_000448 [Bacillus sp. F9_6S_D1_P_5]